MLHLKLSQNFFQFNSEYSTKITHWLWNPILPLYRQKFSFNILRSISRAANTTERSNACIDIWTVSCFSTALWRNHMISYFSCTPSILNRICNGIGEGLFILFPSNERYHPVCLSSLSKNTCSIYDDGDKIINSSKSMCGVMIFGNFTNMIFEKLVLKISSDLILTSHFQRSAVWGIRFPWFTINGLLFSSNCILRDFFLYSHVWFHSICKRKYLLLCQLYFYELSHFISHV